MSRLLIACGLVAAVVLVMIAAQSSAGHFDHWERSAVWRVSESQPLDAEWNELIERAREVRLNNIPEKFARATRLVPGVDVMCFSTEDDWVQLWVHFDSISNRPIHLVLRHKMLDGGKRWIRYFLLTPQGELIFVVYVTAGPHGALLFTEIPVDDSLWGALQEQKAVLVRHLHSMQEQGK